MNKNYSVVFKSSYVFSSIKIDPISSARFAFDPTSGVTLSGSDYVVNYLKVTDKRITATIAIQEGNSFEIALDLLADAGLKTLNGTLYIGSPDVNGSAELRIDQKSLNWSDKPDPAPGPIKAIPFVVTLQP